MDLNSAEKPLVGLTENLSPTFLTSGNPCLDFFFQVVPDTEAENLVGLLEIAWAFNPLLALKLICNLRGVRGTGKSDKEGFYTAALWLFSNHPKTLAGNVKAIAEFGYFKDFLEILYRILEGPDIRKIEKAERRARRRRCKRARRNYFNEELVEDENENQSEDGYGTENDYEHMDENEDQKADENEEIVGDTNEKKVQAEKIEGAKEEKVGDTNEEKMQAEKVEDVNKEKAEDANGLKNEKENDEENEDKIVENSEEKSNYANEDKMRKREKKEKIMKTLDDIQREKEEARALRKEKERNKAKKALEMYYGDENYRLLHDSISGFFVELLTADVERLNSGKLNEISLAAKWCPMIDSSYDKATLIYESIARRMFPKEKYPEYEGLEDQHYAYRVRNRLRKEVLVPLHKVLELPEVYMSANKWNTLPYNRVASVAMKKYSKLFSTHDKERFQQYLDDVKSGKAKIAAGALLPHEIVGAVKEEDGREVAELQWNRLVDDMKKKGKLSNCIAVSDVSGSMYGIPMEVSVALGVLISEVSEEPWKGRLITFSEIPKMQKVEGETLLEKTKFVKNMDWGRSTNFQGVFDRILEVAVEGNLKEEELVKRVFVFSDMEFNQASSNPWETDYLAIQRKFGEKGYNKVPEIVFWNLRDSRSVPVAGQQSGVALVSGFSKNLLTLFLDGGGIVNPVEVMELAVAGEEYQKLKVFD